MKKIILIIGIILCSLIVYAIEGDIEVYSFKVYVDGERQTAGWEDEGFDIWPGSTLELQIRLKNNYNQSNINVDVTGILYDIGDDITREKSFEIDEDEKKTFVLEYYIPADTKEGIYDLEIAYEYEAIDYGDNATLKTYKHEKTFEIDVIKSTVPITDVLMNLTKELGEERARSNDLLSTVLDTYNITMELGQCKSELGESKLNEEFKSKYDDELNKSRTFENQFTTCNTQKQNMYSQSQMDVKVEEEKKTARREQKVDDDNFLLMVVGGFLVWNYMKKKKETVGGAGEGVSLKGGTWK